METILLKKIVGIVLPRDNVLLQNAHLIHVSLVIGHLQEWPRQVGIGALSTLLLVLLLKYRVPC
jgi:hypothetical protein